MSHVALVEYEAAADPVVRAVYDEIVAELGFSIVPNLFKSMAMRPDFLEAQWQLFRSTMLEGELPRTLKEMIGVVISQQNGSDYALKVHLHSLSVLGISETVLGLLVTDFEACPLPHLQKEVIRFALRAAVAPALLIADDYRRLRGLDLSESEIFEIIATANLFTAVNQYTDCIALEVDSLEPFQGGS